MPTIGNLSKFQEFRRQAEAKIYENCVNKNGFDKWKSDKESKKIKKLPLIFTSLTEFNFVKLSLRKNTAGNIGFAKKRDLLFIEDFR